MKVLKQQHWHLLSLLALLTGLYLYIDGNPELLYGELFGMASTTWFWLAIIAPIVHQFYVLVCWRLELFYGSISRTFGAKGFQLYKIGFAVLILSRMLTIILLALSSANTLAMNAILAYSVAAILSIPSAYLFYSVKRYFGMDRAFGIDHFHPKKYRNEPFVKQGIFKYTSNGMYSFGFLVLWIPGLLLLSKAALLAALFNHTYIWAHYYFTELPDMKTIYK